MAGNIRLRAYFQRVPQIRASDFPSTGLTSTTPMSEASQRYEKSRGAHAGNYREASFGELFQGARRIGLHSMSEPQDDLRWYCLKTQSKHEQLVAARLRSMSGVEIYCPMLRLQRSTTRGLRWFVEAMFPGYIFAKFPFALHHREIRAANGVSGIVHFGSNYAVIQDSVVEELRLHTGADHIAVIKSDVVEGGTVQIAEGPLLGLSALVTRVLPGTERIRILLNFLGTEIQAEVSKSSVLPEQHHPLET